MSLTLTSLSFEAGGPIPAQHTADGKNLSPQLTWSDVPDGTRQLALTCVDPDAPTTKPWVHWILYKIPATLKALAEGGRGVGTAGLNDFGDSRYGGPSPPKGSGVHHYHFKLYALSTPVALEKDATKEQLLASMEGHVLEQAELVGTYERLDN